MDNRRNFEEAFVALKDTEAFKSAGIPVILGTDDEGNVLWQDLRAFPHVLVGGDDRKEKDKVLLSIIHSILRSRTPEEMRLMLVDPSGETFSRYNQVPHTLCSSILSSDALRSYLEWLLEELEDRYELLASHGVRNTVDYNRKVEEGSIPGERKLPYIVVFFEEFGPYMDEMGKELEEIIGKLAAKARAAGIHLVLGTCGVTTEVVTASIKSNIFSRIALEVSSSLKSRILLDAPGAEELSGSGDMLVYTPDNLDLKRIQGVSLSDEEMDALVSSLMAPKEKTEDDEKYYGRALEIVHEKGFASASYLQRAMQIGYSKALRLVERMEAEGIIGPAEGSNPRKVLK